jgi:putative addiction module killer protein
MIEVRKTDIFAKWISSLKDRRARVRILVRIDRLITGHLGDVRSVGEGVSELRIFYGPGYRIYFSNRNAELIFLLCAGDKSTQRADIAKAIKIAKQLGD